jgi:uncharacterized protein (TIGR02246 family)
MRANESDGINSAAAVAHTDSRRIVDKRMQIFGIAQDQQTDVAAIVELVAALQHAQQNELPDAFMALFRTPHPVWTTAHGRCLSGWDEINTFTHDALPGAMKKSTAIYEVVRILFVRPDVAVVNVHQRPVLWDSRSFEGVPEGRPIYVMAKDDGNWRIAAGQNTHVMDAATK